MQPGCQCSLGVLLCWSGAGTGPGDAAAPCSALAAFKGREGHREGKGRQEGLSQVLLMRGTGCQGAERSTGFLQHPYSTQREKGQGSLALRQRRADTAPAAQRSCLGQKQVWKSTRESPQSWDSCHQRGLWLWDAHTAAPGVTWRVPQVALPGAPGVVWICRRQSSSESLRERREKCQEPFPIASDSPAKHRRAESEKFM